METSEILDRAADEIERRGDWRNGTWYYHQMDDPDSPLCLEGALQAAQEMPNTESNWIFRGCAAYRAVKEYLGWELDLWKWNDRIAERQEDVVEVLRGAAEKERLKEQEKVHE